MRHVDAYTSLRSAGITAPVDPMDVGEPYPHGLSQAVEAGISLGLEAHRPLPCSFVLGNSLRRGTSMCPNPCNAEERNQERSECAQEGRFALHEYGRLRVK